MSAGAVMAINAELLRAMPRPTWTHKGKRPSYFAGGEWSKDASKAHDVDPVHNAQGDWTCRICGELVRIA